jgi:hypothetical protein
LNERKINKGGYTCIVEHYEIGEGWKARAGA